MGDICSMSLKELSEIEEHMPEVGGFPSRVIASQKSYEEWVLRLYIDIDRIIKDTICPSASYRQDDPEDRFNLEIANSLKHMGYQAAHDLWMNGHPDIHVENRSRGYKWTGESKIHSSYENLMEGFRQLCERYTSGFENENRGAVFIITKNENIKKMMDRWKETLKDSEEYSKSAFKIQDTEGLSFESTHNHSKSGMPYEIKHIPISIRFSPTDKSARSKKN